MSAKNWRTVAALLFIAATVVAVLIVGARHDEITGGGARTVSLRELWFPGFLWVLSLVAYLRSRSRPRT